MLKLFSYLVFIVMANDIYFLLSRVISFTFHHTQLIVKTFSRYLEISWNFLLRLRFPLLSQLLPCQRLLLQVQDETCPLMGVIWIGAYYLILRILKCCSFFLA